MARTVPSHSYCSSSASVPVEPEAYPISTREANLHRGMRTVHCKRSQPGAGSPVVQSLTEVLIFASFLAEERRGRVLREIWRAAELALNKGFAKGWARSLYKVR